MKGKISNGGVGNSIANLDVNLVDSKGRIIQHTKTDANGLFRFERLDADKNYTLKLNDNDALLASSKKVFLSNEADKIVKEINFAKKENAFKNLPPNLMDLAELKTTLVTPLKDSVSVIHKDNMYPGDNQFDFVVYFPYNKKEIDISVGSFLSLMEKVGKTINENGKATIIIAASSSSVPTKSFTSNEELSQIRANEIKDKVRASMSLKNLDAAKITYDISTKVQGPAYKNDAMPNRKEYEKWQFVKVLVK